MHTKFERNRKGIKLPINNNYPVKGRFLDCNLANKVLKTAMSIRNVRKMHIFPHTLIETHIFMHTMKNIAPAYYLRFSSSIKELPKEKKFHKGEQMFIIYNTLFP